MINYDEKNQKLFMAVNNLRAGDADSFYVIYDLSIKYIYKIIYEIIKDHHTTEDLVQETYLTIYKKINTLEDVNKFYAWAGRIASNYSLRYIEKNNKDLLKLDSEDGAAEFAFEVATQDNEEFIPENILMDREKQRIIAQIIDGLSTEQKLAVQYFYYEEMSVTEIAETMGCSRGTIMSRLNYARKAIKAAVVDLAENQGTKLYSLSALPLFHIVFWNSVESFTVSATVGEIFSKISNTLETTITKGATTIETAGNTVGSTAGINTTIETTTVTGASAGNGMSVGGTVVSSVAKGALGKIGASLGVKIATGVLTAGLLTTGGIMIHNAVTGEDLDSGKRDKEPDMSPMVVCLESEENIETIDIFDDRFFYEYINVTYNDREITIGFDGDIYQFGYDSYETLSPELKKLHEKKYEEVVDAENKKLKKIFDEEIEFTIDNEEFTLHVEDVELEQNEEKGTTTIIITGDCETPRNVEQIYEKYLAGYKEKYLELVKKATTNQSETDGKNGLIREYYKGVLRDFYLYGTDPFGNSIEYIGPYAQAPSDGPKVTHYAIYDMDGDGLLELFVKHTYGGMIYGYNPDNQVVVEEYVEGSGGTFIPGYDYYDTGFVVRDYAGYIEVFKWEENTDVYNGKSSIWSCQNMNTYIFGPVNNYAYFDNINNPEKVELEQELLKEYDKDEDGLLWVEIENAYTSEEKIIACYDRADLEAKIKQVALGGNKITLEFIDINTIEADLDIDDIEPEEEPDKIMNSHYLKIVEDFFLYGNDPYGTNYDGRHGDTQDYAICDIDGDEAEELIVRYRSFIGIYGYDSNTMQVREEYSQMGENISVTDFEFYENGYVLIDDGDKFVMKMDTITGSNEYLFRCYCNDGITWYQWHANEPESDVENLYNYYDVDRNGVIYFEELYDPDTNEYIRLYHDDAGVNERILEALDGNKPLNIEFIDMYTVVN